MIELQNFSKKYFRKNKVEFAVENISFKLEKGKIYGLLGPNGSGKSTILKAICGIHYPDEGKILISGKALEFFDAAENPQKIMEEVGLVPEVSSLPPFMSVADFLEYSAKVHGMETEAAQKSIIQVVKEFGLEKVLNKKIKTLSKGFLQRVSFAQCLIHNPENLILDEPVSGLDPSQIINMRKFIKDKSEGKTVILSTHLLQEVTELCDYIFIMKEGKLVARGTAEEITKAQKAKNLEQAFFTLTGGQE